MYAIVLVNLPIEGTFHYHIPPDLAGRLKVGHLVTVSFGTQRAQGVVLGFDQHAPVTDTKPIEALLDHVPVVGQHQLALARWLSETYLAPLADCTRLLLPPGLSKRGDVLVSLVDGADEPQATAARADTQARILALLRKRGPLRGRQLARSLPKRNWQAAVRKLARDGLVERVPVLQSPSVQARRVRAVALATPPEEVEAAILLLGKPSAHANALEAIAASQDPLPYVDDICTLAGCSPEHVAWLARKKMVLLSPARKWVSRTDVQPSDKLSPAMSAVIETLDASAETSLTDNQLGANSNTLAALEGRGLVTLQHEAAKVNLQLSQDQVVSTALELRGAQRQAAVLRALIPFDQPQPVSWLYAETGARLDDLKTLAEEELITLGEQEVWRDPLAKRSFVPAEPPILTKAQATAWQTIQARLRETGPRQPILVHGVTGSGKTELYLRAVQEMLEQGRGAIILVPEIALTPQTLRRFAARFGGYQRMAVIHSALSSGERYDAWRRARAGLVDIVIGPRSALFTPLPDIGLIVMDEAHDDSYKQTPPIAPPYYDARRAAIELARQHDALVIMGTATPDLTTYRRTEEGIFTLLEMPWRIMGHRRRIQQLASQHRVEETGYYTATDAPADAEAVTIDLPPVQVVDMRQELRAGNRSMFSRAMQEALDETLMRREQAILFINRRGHATHIMCRNCGHTLLCPRCETPLTLHDPRKPRLTCHHCGHRESQPERCPECDSTHIRHFGVGTERVEVAVRERWPDATSVRWDSDTTASKGSHEVLLNQFASGEADLLIGTQMVAKGLDLPLVTLVGVVNADSGLFLPDYRAGERVFQVLTQVAGRAGRGLLGGQVILQTYNPHHYVIRAAAAHDFHSFYEQEMAYRRKLGYPPLTHMARILFRYHDEQQARQAAQDTARHAAAYIEHKHLDATSLIGPAPCFYQKLDNQYRWQVIIRGPRPVEVLRGIQLAPEWKVDIDPVSTL